MIDEIHTQIREVSPTYVRKACLHAENLARARQWQEAVFTLQQVLALLDARRPLTGLYQFEMDFVAVVHWVDIVTRAVCEVPDGRLYADAVRRAEPLASIIEPPAEGYGRAEILQRLGILHLDPYIGGRGFEAFPPPMPDAAEALGAAIGYFRRAADHRGGVDRGLTLRALVQATAWQSVVGVVPDAKDLAWLARAASLLLADDRYVRERAEMATLVAWISEGGAGR